MLRRSGLAVATGVAVDIGMTMLSSVAIGFAAVLSGGVLNLPEAEQDAAMKLILESARWPLVTSLLLGLVGSVCAGSVAGSLSHRRPATHGALAAAIAAVVAWPTGMTSEVVVPSWAHALGVPISATVGAVAASVWAKRRQPTRSRAAAA